MYEDTSPEAMNVWVDLIRRTPPGRKMDRVSALNRIVTGTGRRVIVERNSAWCPERVKVEFARLHYGDVIARGLAARFGVALD